MTDGPEPADAPAGACVNCGHQQVDSGVAVGGDVGVLNLYFCTCPGRAAVPPVLGALMRQGVGQLLVVVARVTRSTADFLERRAHQSGCPGSTPAEEGTDP